MLKASRRCLKTLAGLEIGRYLIFMLYGRRAHREVDFRAGMRSLAEHRPDLALHSLRAAADACPATMPSELCRDLYWLALALLRLDRPELAVKSLASAQKLRPRGFARRLYLRRVNDYGMCRRSSVELDDFYAFYSLHACAFLKRKPKGRFDSNAEKDVVTRLIGDAWRNLLRSGKLAGLSSAKKLTLFKSWTIAFPLFSLKPEPWGRVIDADFRRGGLLLGSDRCPCGSGLPFMRCCGRGHSSRESSCE
jgi:hypothetical protein